MLEITRPLQLRLEALRRPDLPGRPLQLGGERGGQVMHDRLRDLGHERFDQSPDVSLPFEPDSPGSGFVFVFGSVFGSGFRFFSSLGDGFR